MSPSCTHLSGSYVPVPETPDDLLKKDDSVSDGLVPLHLQQHVMVVLEDETPESTSPGPMNPLFFHWKPKPGAQWGSQAACLCWPQ